MTIDMYYVPASPPCRTVQVVAKILGIELNLHLVDFLKGEHMTPKFLQMNPQHSLPTIVDNGFSLSESRAIITYLMDKYSKNDSLYPRDIKRRAVINQRLYFDCSVLYQRFMDLYFPKFFGGAELDEAKEKRLDDAFNILEEYLSRTRCVAEDSYTLADISVAVTVSTIEVSGYDISKYPSVAAWMARVKTSLPAYEVNQKGVEAFKALVS
ncbi:glutathione S-transferase 1-like isoform X1 [Homalodisca vitripennis]|uniref:glutathione S-transferase 1-like isoform X1 n=1 Tax=Homalodisca vitripennis TaxID=197043 RepID=UPI001EEC3C3F|nr:glutathione S-transferase 1-like isoform X1 [Homalodisca vitripennis]